MFTDHLLAIKPQSLAEAVKEKIVYFLIKPNTNFRANIQQVNKKTAFSQVQAT